jgi:hypothetical protein
MSLLHDDSDGRRMASAAGTRGSSDEQRRRDRVDDGTLEVDDVTKTELDS